MDRGLFARFSCGQPPLTALQDNTKQKQKLAREQPGARAGLCPAHQLSQRYGALRFPATGDVSCSLGYQRGLGVFTIWPRAAVKRPSPAEGSISSADGAGLCSLPEAAGARSSAAPGPLRALGSGCRPRASCGSRTAAGGSPASSLPAARPALRLSPSKTHRSLQSKTQPCAWDIFNIVVGDKGGKSRAMDFTPFSQRWAEGRDFWLCFAFCW